MNRRNVLRAAGAASTIPFASGIATANSADGDGGASPRGRGSTQRECPLPNCIHPTLGYTGLTGDHRLPRRLQPDHEVNLLIRPREDAEVPIPEFYFEPTGLAIDEGDVVRFNLTTPDHTVTAYHPGLGRQRRVPEGVPAFSSPVLSGGTYWLYRFEHSGVYDLLCAPHEVFGMVMRIVVDEPSADWLDGEEEPAIEEEGVGPQSEDPAGEQPAHMGRPPELTAALVFGDPALAPETIESQGSVSWDEIAAENKRLLLALQEPEE